MNFSSDGMGRRGEKPSALRLPPDAVARIHLVNRSIMICVAAPPIDESPAGILSSTGAVSIFLEHDEGCDWPDRTGELMADEILRAGGGVMFTFARFADGLRFHRRLLATQ